MFIRRSFLAATAAACLLPFLRWPWSCKPAGLDRDQRFQLPIWTPEETCGADSRRLSLLARYHALDIRSSRASAAEVLARLEQIKHVNPDLHAQLLRELPTCALDVARLPQAAYAALGGNVMEGHDAQAEVSFRFNYQHLFYLVDGSHYVDGAKSLSLSASSRRDGWGEGGKYWIDAPGPSRLAVATFDRLSASLRAPELVRRAGEFRESIRQTIEFCDAGHVV